MDNLLKKKPRNLLPVLLCIMLLISICVGYPSTVQAIMPAPKIGVDYQSMKVENPAILRAEGMRNVDRGDSVDIQLTGEGTVIVENKRTGEKIEIDLSGGRFF